MTVYMGRLANQRKVPNGSHLKTTSENHQVFDAHMWGHMCICIPNMQFLCLNLWLGKMCTDNANHTNNVNDDTQWTKHDCIRLFG